MNGHFQQLCQSLPEGKSHFDSHIFLPEPGGRTRSASAERFLKNASSGNDPPGSCECKVFPWWFNMTTRLGWGKKNYGFVGKRIEKRIYLLESLELNLTFLYVFLILLFNYFFIFFGGQVTMSFRHFFSKRKTRWVSPKQKVCFPKRTTKSRWFPELSRAAPTPFPTQAAGDSPRWPMT